MAKALRTDVPNFFVMPNPANPKGIELYDTYWQAKGAHDERPGSLMGRLNYHSDGER